MTVRWTSAFASWRYFPFCGTKMRKYIQRSILHSYHGFPSLLVTYVAIPVKNGFSNAWRKADFRHTKSRYDGYIISTVDFGWFVPFGENQNFLCLKLIEIVILWVYYIIPFGFSLFGHFLVITFQIFILHVWLRITDEGSVPEMLIWSILLI